VTRSLALHHDSKAISGQEPRNGWKLPFGMAVEIGGALVEALSEARLAKAR